MSTKTIEAQGLDVSFLSELLTDPDLFAASLPDEDELAAAARRAAAADITDAYVQASITDHPDGIEAGIAHVAELARLRTNLWAEQAQADVARWLDQIRGAAA
ncbi:hypothetical protein ABZ799_28905 [Nocardiopsis dassonvillei]|uniref:hypothetical protein n=1 Tax=Nocardiopsis dassonvillei TaxID=2014 RepID=UPI0033CAEC26